MGISKHTHIDSKHLLHKGVYAITLKEMAVIVADPFCYPDEHRKVAMHLRVLICTAIGWPHANAWHFSYCQILHIFDLQCCIIGHQLNNYWVVIILNLSVQNCRNEIEGLVILAFAWSSTTMQIFSCSLKTYQSFFFFFLLIFVNTNKKKI